MAKSCAGCGFYDAAGTVERCEKCNRPLQTTFLPPPGAATGPAVKWGPPLATPQTAPRGATYGPGSTFDGLGFMLRNRVLFGLIAAPVVLCLRLAFGGLGGGFGDDIEDRYDKIQAGMTAAQVEPILYGGTKFERASRPLMRDGSGTMSYEEDGIRVTVSFLNGRVVNKSIADDEDDGKGSGNEGP